MKQKRKEYICTNPDCDFITYIFPPFCKCPKCGKIVLEKERINKT